MATLEQLSVRAHKLALEHDRLPPAEMQEFMHLPMGWLGGYPVFDSRRMRPDQIVEVTERLERMVGRAPKGSVRDAVAEYMEAYGRFGLRVQDICAAVEASKPIVLKYLRELIEDGDVAIKEEKTRGKGSMRKRYVWLGNRPDYSPAAETDDGLVVTNDRFVDRNMSTGVFAHGTVPGGFQCGCGHCRYALESAFEAEERSAAREAGGSGFWVGLERRTARRLAAQREAA